MELDIELPGLLLLFLICSLKFFLNLIKMFFFLFCFDFSLLRPPFFLLFGFFFTVKLLAPCPWDP